MALSTLLLTLAAIAPPQDSLPTSPAAIETPELGAFTPPDPVERTLASGVRLLYVEDALLPLVDGILLLPAGDLRDPLEQVGLGTLWAEGLRKGGAEAFTGPELDAWLTSHAVQLGISSTPSTLRIEFNCLSEDLPELLARLGQLLSAPAFSEGALEVARGQLLTSIARREDDSAALADETLDRLLYGESSPWGAQPSEASVAAIERPDLDAQHARFVGRDRLFVGLSGAFDPEVAAQLVDDAFGALPELGAAPALPSKTFMTPSQTTIYLLDKPGVTQTELRIAGPGYKLTDPRQAHMTLWSYVVGSGGMTNRMMARIRTELGLAYGVGAVFVPSLTVPGNLYAYCATRNDAVGEALSEMLEALILGAGQQVPKDELEAARARLLASQVFQTDTSLEVLERALGLAFNDLPRDAWTQHFERIRAADAEAVMGTALRSIPGGRFLCLAVGPAAEIERQLEGVADVVRIGDQPELGDASAQLESLFAALGGRDAWAELETLRIRQDIHIETPTGNVLVEVEQWRRFAPRSIRLRQKTKLGAVYTNVITPEGGQLRAPTGLSEVDATQVASWQAVLSRWLYYNLHLLAAGSPEVKAGLDDEGRIVLLDSLGEVGRITLDDAGRPVTYAVREGGEDKLYTYSNWQLVDGVRIAMGYTDGVQNVELLEVEPNAPMDDATFRLD